MSEQLGPVCLLHLFFSGDRAVIFIPCVLTSEQGVIYKSLCLPHLFTCSSDSYLLSLDRKS